MNILNKNNITRLLTTVCLLVVFALPLSAQEETDSVLTFRFFSGRNMFYAPGLNNGSEIKRMFKTVDQYKEKILDHRVMLYVDGYCNSRGNKATNLGVAKIRSNRVKSELITRKGLKENCFVTHNHAEKGDFVTVRMVIPQSEIVPEPEVTQPEAPVTVEETPALQVVENTTNEAVEPEAPVTVEESPDVDRKEKTDSRFALKTNLLAYAILMPNGELEWMFSNRWSAALEIQGAWYSRHSPRKVYRISTTMLEARYWVIEKARWNGMYVGVFGGAGLYDLHFSPTKNGHEGEGYMGGVSIGYMWPISKHLSFDAGIGVGYMHISDKVYKPADGHFLYQYTKDINYVGPLRLKLSLVWRIPH